MEKMNLFGKKKEKRTDRKIPSLQELNLYSDFLFSRLMYEKESCKLILEKILKVSIKEVVVCEKQKTIDLMLDSKGVRLDIYINDEKGTVYNLEMQTGHKRELPKRTRYYQGNIDLDLITKNEPYENLKTSYVIFICTFDPFADGRHIYTFKNICMENKELLLGDETIKIFLNTRGKKNDIDYDLEEFLKYVENTTDGFVENTKSDFVKTIHKNVKQIKASKELEVEYMTLMQREREIMEEAREEGREEGREEILFQLYTKGMINSEIILKELKITDSEFEQLLKKYK